ncbi:putative T6SS immunity periplasmic lipoprotein [Erwinia sp. S59]|uniref:putative T6SS immunity periplasmic lipoprotein n=1 Tax=Erwinia sp. S59 TaxID=2769340 RepID=UPI00336C04D3
MCSLLMVFVLSGCIGDKFTPSKQTLVSKVDGRICFTVLQPGDYSLSYFYLFERGRRDSAQQPDIAGYRTDNGLLLCMAEDITSSSENDYVAQFGLMTQTRRKPIRNFSVAFKAYNTGVISVPLQRNEITYYIGRGY